jgi:predicted deacylase
MPDTTPPQQFTEQILDLPSPGPGTTRKITAYRYGNPGSKPKLYIQTALHADEIPGMLVVHHLRVLLNKSAKLNDIKGEIIIVPVANPIGMSQRIQGHVNGRLDFNNGKNYNRSFPDLVTGISEIIDGNLTASPDENDTLIRNALVQVINELPELSEADAYRKALLSLCADADMCLDLHCDSEAILYLYSTGHHPEQADQLSTQLGCEVHLVDSTTTQCFDGSISLAWAELINRFPDYPIAAGCMGGTIELRGKTDVSDNLAQQDAANLMQFLVRQNIVNGPEKELPVAKCHATPLEGQLYLYSPHTGVVIYHRNCGDKVQKGETVAELVDPVANPDTARTCLVTSITGTVFSRSSERLVAPGQIVMGIAGDEVIPERVGTHLLSD